MNQQGDMIDFEKICACNAMTRPEAAQHLLTQMEEIYAVLYEIDIAIAGHNENDLVQALSEIKALCKDIGAMQVYHVCTIMEELLHHSGKKAKGLHHFSRMDMLMERVRYNLHIFRQQIENEVQN